MSTRGVKITLLAVTLILCLLGLFFVFEASGVESYQLSADTYYQLKKQAAGLGIGLLALLIASRFPNKFLIKLAWPLYIIALTVTIFAFIPGFSNELLGAKRWVAIGPISFQTVEVVKLCSVVFFAWLFSRKTNWQTMIIFTIPLAVLILLQRDLGSLLVLGTAVFAMYFIAGAKLKDIGIIAGGALVLILIMILAVPFRRERLLAYLHWSSDTEAAASVDTWHVDQLLLGLGRGGIFGQGIGNSRQKFSFVPEPSTDSIFAIVGEEIGFFGCALILMLYIFFLYLIFRLVKNAPLSQAQSLLGYGILALFAAQIFLNIAAISSLTPLTGITLPFFSYGSSSLTISLSLVGVVLGLNDDGRPVVKKRRARIIKR